MSHTLRDHQKKLHLHICQSFLKNDQKCTIFRGKNFAMLLTCYVMYGTNFMNARFGENNHLGARRQ